MSNPKLKNAISLNLKQEDAIFIHKALEMITYNKDASNDARTKAWKLMVRITDGLMKQP